jgi:hypothetical protein
MNLDTTVYRMAFREADTLGVAQVLVAKKRADLEQQMTLKTINEGKPTTGADLDRALADMEKRSDTKVREMMRAVDKYA